MTDEEIPDCPQCGAPALATIIYGRVEETPELLEQLERGEVLLAGCAVTGDDPEWRCNTCGVYVWASGIFSDTRDPMGEDDDDEEFKELE